MIFQVGQSVKVWMMSAILRKYLFHFKDHVRKVCSNLEEVKGYSKLKNKYPSNNNKPRVDVTYSVRCFLLLNN